MEGHRRSEQAVSGSVENSLLDMLDLVFSAIKKYLFPSNERPLWVTSSTLDPSLLHSNVWFTQLELKLMEQLLERRLEAFITDNILSFKFLSHDSVSSDSC